MSDWVNWQQLAEMAKPEVQRLADVEREDNERQRLEAAKAVSRVRRENEANLTLEGKGGGYRAGPIQGLASYSDAMKQRDAAMGAHTARVGGSAAWERDLRGGQDVAPSPWESLNQRLGAVEATGDAWRAQWRQNEADAEAKRKKAAERAAADAERRRNFYAEAYRSLPDAHLTEDDKRQRAGMLYRAGERREWDMPNDPYARGALWETGFGVGDPFKTPGNPFASKPQNRYDRQDSTAPKKPSGWEGW